MNLTESLPYK